jgi:hypothetical protein
MSRKDVANGKESLIVMTPRERNDMPWIVACFAVVAAIVIAGILVGGRW